MTIDLVILHCGVRTAHFGMGSFSTHLFEYFKTHQSYNVTLLKVDSKGIETQQYKFEDGHEVIEIPQPENKLFLNDDDTIVQSTYAKRISEMVSPYFKSKCNLIILCNTVVHYWLAMELKIRFNGRLVYVHHNFTWKTCWKTSYEIFGREWIAGNTSRHPAAFWGTLNQKKIADLSDAVVTVTNIAERLFVDVLNVSQHKIRTIYNGVPGNTTSHRKDRSRLRKKYGFSVHDRIILFCGRIVEEKGLSYLLRAFESVCRIVPKARLLVIGGGDIQDHLSMVDPVWSRVTFTGKLRYSVIAEMYAIADVGVMPSTQEQCSITSIEMRFHGLPMIVSAVEGLDELFEDGFDALKIPVIFDTDNVISFSEQEIAKIIITLLNDHSLRKALSNNAYSKGLRLFTSERMTKEYDQLFRSFFSESFHL